MDTLTASNNHPPLSDPAAAEAENDLLRHLALMGELSERRELLRSELAGVEHLLGQARQHRASLVQRVQQQGGQLPTWDLRSLSSSQDSGLEVK